MIRQPTHDLAEQCEQPLGPDPKLDRELWAAMIAEPRANPEACPVTAPPYTSSLDKGMTLIPPGREYVALTEAIKNCSKFTHSHEQFRENLPRFLAGAAVYETLFVQSWEDTNA